MAGDYGMPGGNLEEQVRQMLAGTKLKDEQGPHQQEQQTKPVVRLPPSLQRPHMGVGHAAAPANQPHAGPREIADPRGHRFLAGLLPDPYPRHQSQAQNRRSNQPPLDPNAFPNRGRGQYNGGPGPTLFDPRANQAPLRPLHRPDDQYFNRQTEYLEDAVQEVVPAVDMPYGERKEKDQFRLTLQSIIQELCAASKTLPVVSLECFGSFQSGFATAGSDMDLVIVLRDGSVAACFSLMEDNLPRSLEKRLLELGFGARLLTRTRVPILKLCENPSAELLQNLRDARVKWDALSEEDKYPHLYPSAKKEDAADKPSANSAEEPRVDEAKSVNAATVNDERGNGGKTLASTRAVPAHDQQSDVKAEEHSGTQDKNDIAIGKDSTNATIEQRASAEQQQQRDQRDREWTRERKSGPLDFPSHGVGIQSDINFFNPLGLHNTQLLRCYSLCDSRVRPMVLFVKAWAKRRKINSSYSGTLSSYGYVLMVLHYLINIAEPPVLPNLQLPWRPGPGYSKQGQDAVEVDGWTVDFWRNEDEIQHALDSKLMTPNAQPVGALLAGFFHYFSALSRPSFHFLQDCLSLRSVRGIVSKDAKGWVKAVTEESDGRRVQHRYLFCIEDPFELSHNVARTVTHHGIVAIRNEFRRAHDILHSVGNGVPMDLFAEVQESDLDEAAASSARRKNHTPNDCGAVRGGRNGTSTHAQAPGIPNCQVQAQKRPSPAPPQVASEDAFPTLNAAKSQAPVKKGGHKKNASSNNGNFGEISGDRAKAIVEEARRKKMERHAEHTAMGAAEAVLEGFD